jgi:hypothetical protein
MCSLKSRRWEETNENRGVNGSHFGEKAQTQFMESIEEGADTWQADEIRTTF